MDEGDLPKMFETPVCEKCQTGGCLIHCINPKNSFTDKIFDGCKFLIGSDDYDRCDKLISMIGFMDVYEGVKMGIGKEKDEKKQKEMKDWIENIEQ